MRFGPAGYPKVGSRSDPEASLGVTKEMGLDALEVEFVRGARISEERARAIGACARGFDIRLSCHAPYFISFNSDNPETIDKSVQWVVDTARAAHWLGAYIIVIHAAAYGSRPEAATENVIKGLAESKDRLDDMGIKDVILGVETMGKKGQFGTLKEITQVMSSVDGVRPVLDVAHVHARGGGCIKNEEDMRALVDEFFPLCGDVAHFHISCIKYGEKGEISHLPLSEMEPDMQYLADVLGDSDRDCTFICESPLVEKDAAVFRDMFPKYRRARKEEGTRWKLSQSLRPPFSWHSSSWQLRSSSPQSDAGLMAPRTIYGRAHTGGIRTRLFTVVVAIAVIVAIVLTAIGAVIFLDRCPFIGDNK